MIDLFLAEVAGDGRPSMQTEPTKAEVGADSRPSMVRVSWTQQAKILSGPYDVRGGELPEEEYL